MIICFCMVWLVPRVQFIMFICVVDVVWSLLLQSFSLLQIFTNLFKEMSTDLDTYELSLQVVDSKVSLPSWHHHLSISALHICTPYLHSISSLHIFTPYLHSIHLCKSSPHGNPIFFLHLLNCHFHIHRHWPPWWTSLMDKLSKDVLLHCYNLIWYFLVLFSNNRCYYCIYLFMGIFLF